MSEFCELCQSRLSWTGHRDACALLTRDRIRLLLKMFNEQAIEIARHQALRAQDEHLNRRKAEIMLDQLADARRDCDIVGLSQTADRIAGVMTMLKH